MNPDAKHAFAGVAMAFGLNAFFVAQFGFWCFLVWRNGFWLGNAVFMLFQAQLFAAGAILIVCGFIVFAIARGIFAGVRSLVTTKKPA